MKKTKCWYPVATPKRLFPAYSKDFLEKKPAFLRWAVERGSEVMKETNPYELARFTTPEGVGIIYANKHGIITSWGKGTCEAYAAFIEGTSWKVGTATSRMKQMPSEKRRTIEALFLRDGPFCLYCGTDFTNSETPPTLEHIVPVSLGGPEHLCNYALACPCCNSAYGNLPPVTKIKKAVALALTGAK